jgi:hypothetical protein
MDDTCSEIVGVPLPKAKDFHTYFMALGGLLRNCVVF